MFQMSHTFHLDFGYICLSLFKFVYICLPLFTFVQMTHLCTNFVLVYYKIGDIWKKLYIQILKNDRVTAILSKKKSQNFLEFL